MADYKRMVSYMYQYENGVKKKNVGYARVEAKSGECKVTLHMQLPGLLDSIFPTYMIQRKRGEMELIYVGDTMLKNQVMDSKLTTQEADIMDSGYGLSDMGGILLFLNELTFYATEWDDKPVILNEVMDALKPKRKDSGQDSGPPKAMEKLAEDVPVLEEIIQELVKEKDIPIYKLPRGWKSMELRQSKVGRSPVNPWETVDRMRKQMEEKEANDINPVPETGRDPEEQLPPIEQEQEAEPETDTQTAPAPEHNLGPIGDNGGTGTSDQTQENPVASRIFENYPRIYPFEDNEITLCVKIEPKDIGYFPVDAWILSNNSFLMHGYYCYNHLIFAKMRDRGGYRYILGVPGIYHNRERFMARMFGFECFKSIRKRELRQGDFGYWYIPISM